MLSGTMKKKRKGKRMKLTSFIGAAHEVTGSCHLLEACGKHILIDCGGGMEQGRISMKSEIAGTPGEVDYILLTHAHIDHSGLIPLMCKNGFQGSVARMPRTDLCGIMLRDSAHIQEFEAEGGIERPEGRGEPSWP